MKTTNWFCFKLNSWSDNAAFHCNVEDFTFCEAFELFCKLYKHCMVDPADYDKIVFWLEEHVPIRFGPLSQVAIGTYGRSIMRV